MRITLTTFAVAVAAAGLLGGCCASHPDTSVSVTLHGSPTCGNVEVAADAAGWLVLDGHDCRPSHSPESGLYEAMCDNASTSVRVIDGAVEGVDVLRETAGGVYCSWSWRAPDMRAR